MAVVSDFSPDIPKKPKAEEMISGYCQPVLTFINPRSALGPKECARAQAHRVKARSEVRSEVRTQKLGGQRRMEGEGDEGWTASA